MSPTLKSSLILVAVLAAGLGLGAVLFMPNGPVAHMYASPQAGDAQGSQADRSASTDTRSSPRMQPPGPPAMPQTPEAAMRTLDEKFQAETRTPSWAQFNEAQVKAALSDKAMAKEGIPPVIAHSVECRSVTCRIELQMVDDPTTTATPTVLLQAIAENLNSAQIIYVPTKDGELAMRIYARQSDPGNRKPASGAGRQPGS